MPVTCAARGDSEEAAPVARLVLERARIDKAVRRLDRAPALRGVKLLRDDNSGVRVPEEDPRPKAGEVMDLSLVSYQADQCMALDCQP